jgi:hypothetical protein
MLLSRGGQFDRAAKPGVETSNRPQPRRNFQTAKVHFQVLLPSQTLDHAASRRACDAKCDLVLPLGWGLGFRFLFRLC